MKKQVFHGIQCGLMMFNGISWQVKMGMILAVHGDVMGFYQQIWMDLRGFQWVLRFKHGISWDYFVNRNTENLGVNHI